MLPEDMLCSREHDENSQTVQASDAGGQHLHFEAPVGPALREVAADLAHARESGENHPRSGPDAHYAEVLTRCVSRDLSRTVLDSPPTSGNDSSLPSLSDQLRDAILAATCTRYSISKATGIDQATLSRFVRPRSNSASVGLSLNAIDKLAKHLNLELSPRRDSTNEGTPSDGITQQGS